MITKISYPANMFGMELTVGAYVYDDNRSVKVFAVRINNAWYNLNEKHLGMPAGEEVFDLEFDTRLAVLQFLKFKKIFDMELPLKVKELLTEMKEFSGWGMCKSKLDTPQEVAERQKIYDLRFRL